MANEELSFGAPDPDDAGQLVLTADQRAVLARELSEQAFGFKTLAQMLQKGDAVPRSLARSILYMGEARVSDACKLTGLELESATRREERYRNIRVLNERVRELERQLGATGSVRQSIEHIKLLGDNLKRWWRSDGFGHVREMVFTEYGHLKAQLSCHLFGDFSLTNSATPVSDKQRRADWLQSLRDRGLRLHEDEREMQLVDCDRNRELVGELLVKAIPSVHVSSTENHHPRTGPALLRTVSIYVYDLQDLQALTPVNPEVED